jgi:hypothetical protein
MPPDAEPERMSSPDASFTLDTAAWGQARRRRTALRATYWLILIAAAATVAGILAMAASQSDAPPAPVTPNAAAATAKPKATKAAAAAPRPKPVRLGVAPPPAQTPVAVWNGFGGKGAAGTAAARVKALGYPVPAVGNAPKLVYRRTLVLYTKGQAAAAVALAKRLGLPRTSVGVLDGSTRGAIKPARLLLIVGG